MIENSCDYCFVRHTFCAGWAVNDATMLVTACENYLVFGSVMLDRNAIKLLLEGWPALNASVGINDWLVSVAGWQWDFGIALREERNQHGADGFRVGIWKCGDWLNVEEEPGGRARNSGNDD